MDQLRIEIVEQETITKQGKNGDYMLQVVLVYYHNENGEAKRPTPEEIFVPKNKAGVAEPYPNGNYTVHPTSFRRGRYSMDFSLSLQPLSKDSKQSRAA